MLVNKIYFRVVLILHYTFCELLSSSPIFLNTTAAITQVRKKRSALDFQYQRQTKSILIFQEMKPLMQKVIKYCLFFSATGAENKGSYKMTITEIERMKKMEKLLLRRGNWIYLQKGHTLY